MAFKVLTEEELKNLNDREKQLYNEEFELYNERCLFVDRIEKLEKVKYPEIKPNYMYLKKINMSEVQEKINIDNSKIVLEDVFSDELLKRKDSVEKMDLVSQNMTQMYKAEVSNVIISKTKDVNYNTPENEKVELPKINAEHIDVAKEYIFEEVHVSKIPDVLIKQAVYVNEIKDEKINLENMINIDTSYPSVRFNTEDVGDAGIDLVIDNNFKVPTVVKLEESSVSIEQLDAYVPDNHSVNVELPDDVKVNNQKVKVAEAEEIIFDNRLDGNSLDTVDATVINAPQVNMEEVENNVIEVKPNPAISAPTIKDIEFTKNEIMLEKALVAEPSVKEEKNIGEDIQYAKDRVDVTIAKTSVIGFVLPELIVNKSKLIVESPKDIESDAKELLRQIMNTMGENHEE